MNDPDSIFTRDILSLPIAVVDVETTGLSPEKDRVIEIAIVRYNPDGSIQEWSSLVQPQRKIPLRTINIHHITDKMVDNAPLFEELTTNIYNIIDGCLFVAHNVDFDFQFIQNEYSRCHRNMPRIIAKVDTLAISRKIFNFPRNDLQSLIVRFGLQSQVAHRASYDAFNTFQIFKLMLQNLPTSSSEKSIQVIEQLFSTYAKGSDSRKEQRKTLESAIQSKSDVMLEYTSSHPERPLVQYRRIQPQRMDNKWVHGYCYLREAERSFMLRRIRNVCMEQKSSQIEIQSSVQDRPSP